MSDERDGKVLKRQGHVMDCETIRRQLFDYLSHELASAPSTLVREHLRRCPACSEEAARIQKAVDALRSHDPGEDAASAFEGRRRRRLLWLMAHPFIAACLRHHVAVSIIVAIVVLLVGTLVVVRVSRMGEPPKAMPPVELILNGVEEPDAPPLIDVPTVPVHGDPPTLTPEGLGDLVVPAPEVPSGKGSESPKSEVQGPRSKVQSIRLIGPIGPIGLIGLILKNI
ncbi:MAG: anti-sigma factor family protein [Kiritimatiellia bacterium]|jgi:hypothetical protein